MDIEENKEPEKKEEGSSSGRRRRRTRKRVKVKKRIRVKKKKSRKKQIKKLLEKSIWAVVLLAFLITVIFLVLELQEQDGPRKNKGKNMFKRNIEWRSW